MTTTLLQFTPNDSFFSIEYYWSFDNVEKNGSWRDLAEVKTDDQYNSITNTAVAVINGKAFTARDYFYSIKNELGE